ncbi:MAG TPA: hypothetical protein VNJ08_06980 [Bacteriovoracaceae bacterium]|nr:hypothetical protein [Bacteriovoracaceae bacterium]
MKNLITLLMLLVSFNSFGMPTDSEFVEEIADLEEILNQAEAHASSEGRNILETSRSMIKDQEVIKGSCWDYIHAVYLKAGYGNHKRVTIFRSKLQGPYVHINRIESGDWLYFMNHSFGDVEHSGIFVAWTDQKNKEALVISYPGGNQAKPGRYKKYNLRSTYNIIRPAE